MKRELDAQIEKLVNKTEQIDSLEYRVQDMKQNKVDVSSAELSFNKVAKQITKMKTNIVTTNN